MTPPLKLLPGVAAIGTLLVTLAFGLVVACGGDGSAAQAGGDLSDVAVSGGGVTVDVVSTGPRTGGFSGAVRITNGSFPDPITSFEVVFKMPGASVSGSTTIRGPDATGSFTATSPQTLRYQPIRTGRTYDLGFNGTGTFTSSAIVSVRVNGQTIPIGGTDLPPAGGAVSVNSGGAAVGSFQADRYFSGGTTYSNSATVDVTQITSSPPPASVFNTERYGAFSYTIPGLTPGAAYTVTLYFAETYLSAAGQRTFDVSVNGTTSLSSFDIYAAAGGRNRAIARTIDTVASAGGQVVIQFSSRVQNPKVNGLAVAPAGVTDLPPTASVTSSATTVTAASAVTLTAAASDDRGVNRVEFYEGSSLLGSDTTAPYTHVVSFTSADDGVHTYTVRAYDTSGQSTTSAAVTVTVAIGSGGTRVSLIQSSRANASEITLDEVKTMVTQAVDQAGGLGFVSDGMTVVLKPNLLTHLSACWSGTATLSPTVNGVTTDWRVVRAVAELVRARNPSGRILVMEGSARSTTAAFQALGYTAANFGDTVDQFVALEGSGCSVRDTSALVRRTGASGTQYWLHAQYAAADAIISIAALKTHGTAGTTGCVKNLGIGSTPAGAYSASTSSADCTRNYTQSSLPSFITHSSAATLGEFVADFYSARPADFAVMDGLQGMQNGPCSTSSADRMNMRLVLASRSSVALDAVAARVMSCDPAKVPALTRAEAYGLGTIAEASITVVGNRQIADVKKLFRSGVAGVCQ